MPILGPRARENPLVACDDWADKIDPDEKRSDMIETPQGKLTWDLYLTGGEGYVGRDGITSGGIFGLDGQPYIMTPDICGLGVKLLEAYKIFKTEILKNTKNPTLSYSLPQIRRSSLA